jgi:signal transduction histidine kinase
LSRRRAEQEKDEFLSTASHELKTPLTAISLSAQMVGRQLDRGLLDVDRLKRHMTALQEQVVRATRLISDLLDVSRIHTGQMQIMRGPVDLAELTRATVQRARDIQGDDSLTDIRLDVDRTASLVIQGDEARLDQVLTNLLSNAVKYSPNGGEVEISVSQSSGQVIVQVVDHGIGIPEADRERIFAPFNRTVEARKSGIEGTGLGLYITRRIVEAHGGSIDVEATPGGGTTFRVSLPVGDPIVTPTEAAAAS